MEFVAFVIALALLEYAIFGMLVGWARGKYGVVAPATSGHPVFERYFRVHMNTLEQLVAFVPAMWLFGTYVNPTWAAWSSTWPSARIAPAKSGCGRCR